MILTVTLNAALDVTYQVPAVEWDGVNRVAAVHRRAGGKGGKFLPVSGRLLPGAHLRPAANGGKARTMLDILGHLFAPLPMFMVIGGAGLIAVAQAGTRGG